MQYHRSCRLLVVSVALLVAVCSGCQSSGSLSMVAETPPSSVSTHTAPDLPASFTEDTLVLRASSGECVMFGRRGASWYAETAQGKLPVEGGKGHASVGTYLSWLGSQDASVVRSRLHIIPSVSSPTGVTSVYLGKLGLSGGAPSGAAGPPPIATGDATGRLYDVFISHAGEEKESLAIPLYDELKKRGLHPFLDRRTLPYGEAIPTDIDKALDRSLVGVFLLSPNFIAKKWPMYELTYLQNRKESASSTGDISPDLLPVFYKCSKDDCQLPWPSLRKKYKKYFRRHQFQDRVDIGFTNYPQLSAALSNLSTCRGVTSEASAEDPLWLVQQTVDEVCSMLPSLRTQTRALSAPHVATLRHYYSLEYAKISPLFLDKDSLATPLAGLSCTLQCIGDKRKAMVTDALDDKIDEIKLHYERRTRSGESIARENLFLDRSVRPYEPARPIQRILLIGLPGVGKTTLGKQLAYLWSQGSWGQAFKTVYLLFVRELESSQYDGNAYDRKPTLSTAIVNSCFPLRPSNASKYEELRQQVEVTLEDEKTLVILDGLDEREAPNARIINAQEQLLEAARTGKHKLLMLSRAYSVGAERSIADLEIEHVGLSDGQLEAYLQDETFSGLSSEQGADLLSLLRQHPSIFAMAHVPINISLLCYFYKKNAVSVTETVRQGSLSLLYKHLTEYVWKRYRDNVPASKSDVGITLEDREHIFSMLGKVALSTLRDGSMFVDESVLRRHAPKSFGKNPAAIRNHLAEMQTLGFLLLKFLGNKHRNQYQFPHLTFQEYFAARCLADRLTSENASKKASGEAIFLDMCRAPHYGRTLSFLSGVLSNRSGTVGIRRLLSLVAGVRGSLAQTGYVLLQLRLLNEWLCLSDSTVIKVALPHILKKYKIPRLFQTAYRAALQDKNAYRTFTRSAHAFGCSLQHIPVYWQSVANTAQEADGIKMRAIATETLGGLVKASPSLAPICLPTLLAVVGDENYAVYNAASAGLLSMSQGLAYHAKLERDLPALCDRVSGLLTDTQKRRAFHWTLLSLVQTNPSCSALVQAQRQVAPARLDVLLSPSPPPHRHIFGAVEWRYYYGDVGEEPPLPTDIENILNATCPFWGQEGKKVRDTHLLTLIPASVDGEDFSLDLLRDLITYPTCVTSRKKYSFYNDYARSASGCTSPTSSYWLLLTRDVLPDSRKKRYVAQKRMIAAYVNFEQSCALPRSLEVATSVLTHYVRTGERLFPEVPMTFTRCADVYNDRDPLVVGCFGPSGLSIVDSNPLDVLDSHGVAFCWKF